MTQPAPEHVPLFAPTGQPITHESYALPYRAPIELITRAPLTHPDAHPVTPDLTALIDYDSAKSLDGVVYLGERRWMDAEGQLWAAEDLSTEPPAPAEPARPGAAHRPRLHLAHLTDAPDTLEQALVDTSTVPLAHLGDTGLYFGVDLQEQLPVLAYDVTDPAGRCSGVFLFDPAQVQRLPMSAAARAAATLLRAYCDQAFVNAGGARTGMSARPLTTGDLRGVVDALTPDVVREWTAHLFDPTA